jgi:tRNA(Ile)-lysidine synthase
MPDNWMNVLSSSPSNSILRLLAKLLLNLYNIPVEEVLAMLLRVEKFIKKHNMLPQGCKVLAGVSGGADSVALLHILCELRGRLCFALEAAHFNHGIRAEADVDEAFVAALCVSLGVPLHAGRADVPALAKTRGVSLEVAAREARHAFFRKVMAEHGVDRLALAHHMDDQAETVLLRLIRGTGTAGLGAMAPVEASGIIRPFLCVGREDIRAWCIANGVVWREDATNSDTSIPRNFVRGELIPRIRELNPQVSKALCRAAELLREDEEYLLGLACDIVKRAEYRPDGSVALTAAALAALPEALKGRALRLLIGRAGLTRDVERVNIDDVTELLGEGMTGCRVDLGGGFAALREAGALVIAPRLPQSPDYPSVQLNIPGVTQAAGGIFTCEMLSQAPPSYKNHPKAEQYFDAGRFPSDAVARGRLPGDRFCPLGAPGGKKLKEVLIDRKVPRWARDTIPVVASGSEVLWAVGVAIADTVKVADDTRAVLKISYTKGKGSI